MKLYSLSIPDQATTITVAASTTSAQSPALDGESVLITPLVDCFVISGPNPTATTSCLPLLSGQQYRVQNIVQGEKLAFITSSASGNVYITKGV